MSYFIIRSSAFFDYLCAILCSFFNNNNNDKNKNNNNNSTTCIWYEHDPKCTHFSVIIFSQLLARCFISLRGEIWAHRTSLNIWEYRRGNNKWTIQRDWQHRVHKKHDEDKTKTQHNMCWTPLYGSKQN
jgi:hypothetical protein